MIHRTHSSSRARTSRCALGGAIASLLIAPTALAQDEPVQRELGRCRAIAEAAARLRCYDALATGRAEVPAAVSGASAAASPGTEASATTAPSTSAAATSRFGLEHAAKPASDELRTRIAGDFEGWEPKTRFKLANGQVWVVADGSRAYYPRRSSPAVRLTRGALGSFFMEVEGASHAVPVRRVE